MKTLKFLFLIVLIFTFSLSAAWSGSLQLSPYNQKHIPAYNSDEPLRFQKVDFISPWKGKNPRKIISYLKNLLDQGLIDQATQEFIALFQQDMNMAIQVIESMESNDIGNIIRNEKMDILTASNIFYNISPVKAADILINGFFIDTPWCEGEKKAAAILSAMDADKAADVFNQFSSWQNGFKRAAQFLAAMDIQSIINMLANDNIDVVTKENLALGIIENIKPLALSYNPLNADTLLNQIDALSLIMSDNISIETKTEVSTELMSSFSEFYNDWQAYVEMSDMDHADSYNEGNGDIVNTLINIIKELALDPKTNIDTKYLIVDYFLDTFTREDFIPHYQLMLSANALKELEKDVSLAEYIEQERKETALSLCPSDKDVNSIDGYSAVRIAYLVGEDEGLKSLVASNLNITGIALDIWNDFGVIIINQNGVTEEALTITKNTLATLPKWIVSPTKALIYTQDFWPEWWRAAEAWGGFIRLKSDGQWSRKLKHEMAHEVDFIGIHNPDMPFPPDFDFKELYDSSGDNIENFAMEYGMMTYFEDFATFFSWYLEDTLDLLSLTNQRAEDNDPSNDIFVQKVSYIMQMFAYQGEDGKMYTNIFHFYGNSVRKVATVEVGDDGFPIIPDNPEDIIWEVFDY